MIASLQVPLLLPAWGQDIPATLNGNNSLAFNTLNGTSTSNISSSNQQLTIPPTEMTSSNATNSNTFLTYENPNYGISIDYPSNWSYQEAQEDPFTNATVLSIVDIAPPLSEDQDSVTNLQVGLEDLETPISLNQYMRNVINSYRDNSINFSLVSVNDNSTLSGKTAYDIVFTDLTVDGIERKSEEVGVVDGVNNRAYYILFNTESSKYDEIRPIVQQMVGSFELDRLGLGVSSGDINDSEDVGGLQQPDYEDDLSSFLGQQGPSLPSLSSSSPEMDLELFMNSFANSIFNGSSIFGGIGTSMVNGVKVSGISLDDNTNSLSVTLSGRLTEVSLANTSGSVSVIATRIPINMEDILSLAAASDGMDFDQDSIFSSDSFNPFSFLSDLEIGSTSITNADWSVPQTATMNLVGDNNRSQLYPGNTSSTADFLFVSVIPYTGSLS